MKKWTAAAIEELKIEETAYGFWGDYNDGGRWGDGIISGHHTTVDPNQGSDDNTDTDTDTDLNS